MRSHFARDPWRLSTFRRKVWLDVLVRHANCLRCGGWIDRRIIVKHEGEFLGAEVGSVMLFIWVQGYNVIFLKRTERRCCSAFKQVGVKRLSVISIYLLVFLILLGERLLGAFYPIWLQFAEGTSTHWRCYLNNLAGSNKSKQKLLGVRGGMPKCMWRKLVYDAWIMFDKTIIFESYIQQLVALGSLD